MRARLIALAFGLVACGLLAVPALAAAAPQVKVIDRQGNAYVFDLGGHEGREDVDARYTVRSSPSQATTQRIVGFSLRKVLAEAEDGRGERFDDSIYHFVKVDRPGSGVVTLSRAQVEASGAFPDGHPVVWAEQGGGIGFLRPSSGPNDANAADVFVVSDGTLVVREGFGNLVQLEVEYSPSKPRPKQAVTFKVRVKSSASGQRLTFSWMIDGHHYTGAQVTHAFRRKGCYAVGVSARENGEVVGGAGAQVKVGSDCEGGPNRQGGGKEGKKKGAADGSHGKGSGNGSSSWGNGSGTGGPSAPSYRPAPGQRSERPPRQPAPPGETVEGELLDDIAGKPAPAQQAQSEPKPAVRAVRSGSFRDEGGAGVPGVALGILVTGGLLGLGALRELERGPLAKLRLRKPWS